MKKARRKLQGLKEGTQLSPADVEKIMDQSTVSGLWQEDRLVRGSAATGACSIDTIRCAPGQLDQPLRIAVWGGGAMAAIKRAQGS